MSLAAPAPSPAPDPLDALPVTLELSRPDAARVVAWIEGVLGWQPVEPGTGGLAARLRIADVASGAIADAGSVADRGGVDGPPTVLLLSPDDPPPAVARAVAWWAPDATLSWPDERDGLVGVCRRLLAVSRPRAGDELVLRVGGAAGGVGTTTVALGLGALAAWKVGPTLVVTWGVVPAAVPRTVELDSLGGERTFDEAPPVPGVPGLHLVRAAGPPRGVPVDAGPAAALVRDVGVADEVDVLVLRRDAAGIAALERSAAAVAVVLDDGAAAAAAVRGAAGGRPVITLPRSVRVARAGLLARVPTALPGSYLQSLRPLVSTEGRRGRA